MPCNNQKLPGLKKMPDKNRKAKYSVSKIIYLSHILFIFNPTIMIKLFFTAIIFLFVACNNSNTPTADTATAGSDSALAKSYTWTNEEEKDFLAGCVDNAKANVSDTAAYAYCKCVLDQLKQVFPNMDSASAIIMDTTKAAAYVAKCE